MSHNNCKAYLGLGCECQACAPIWKTDEQIFKECEAAYLAFDTKTRAMIDALSEEIINSSIH